MHYVESSGVIRYNTCASNQGHFLRHMRVRRLLGAPQAQDAL